MNTEGLFCPPDEKQEDEELRELIKKYLVEIYKPVSKNTYRRTFPYVEIDEYGRMTYA